MLALILLCVLGLSLSSHGVITNRTIDDTYGDPVGGATVEYGGAWNPGQKCPGCLLQPHPDQLMNGSWHEATNDVHHPGDRNLTLTFTGTAIYIFCVLPNTPVQIPDYVVITAANMTFIVDNVFKNTFHQDPSPTQNFVYNVSVFSWTGLSNDTHTVTVQVLTQSYMAFDYATYTFDDGVKIAPSPSTVPGHSSSPTPTTHDPGSAIPGTSTPAPHKHSSTAAIAGGVIGGLALVTAAIGVWLYRRRRTRPHLDAVAVTPTMSQFPHSDAPSAAWTTGKTGTGPSSTTRSETTRLLPAPPEIAPSTNTESSGPRMPEAGDSAPGGPSTEQVQISQQQQEEIERLRMELQEALAMQAEAPPPYQG